MPTEAYFADSYSAARTKFLTSARDAGAAITTYLNPAMPGPGGIELNTDVAVLGPPDAARCFLLISGTHGVEGFAGSGCQVGFFRDRMFELFGAATRTVVLHALNPYGFAHLRRVNEDNVDLNRNCQDFSQDLPPNAEYEALHPILIPAAWEGEGRRAADEELITYVQRQGFKKLKDAVTAGQYTKPDGLFFGGDKLTWSVLTLQRIVQEHLPRRAKRMVVIDLHTGLGPFGYGEPVFFGNDLRQYFRAREAFGPELTSLEADNSTSSALTGTLFNAVESVISLKEMEMTFLGLEFGTVPATDVLTALRGDHWLHAAGGLEHPLRNEIKKKLRDAFYVDSAPWKTAVYGRAVDFMARAARYLGREPA